MLQNANRRGSETDDSFNCTPYNDSIIYYSSSTPPTFENNSVKSNESILLDLEILSKTRQLSSPDIQNEYSSQNAEWRIRNSQSESKEVVEKPSPITDERICIIKNILNTAIEHIENAINGYNDVLCREDEVSKYSYYIYKLLPYIEVHDNFADMVAMAISVIETNLSCEYNIFQLKAIRKIIVQLRSNPIPREKEIEDSLKQLSRANLSITG